MDLSSIPVEVVGKEASPGHLKGAPVDSNVARIAFHAQSPATGARLEGMGDMTPSVLPRQVGVVSTAQGTDAVGHSPESLPATPAVPLPRSVMPVLPDTTFEGAAASTSHSFPARQSQSPPLRRPRGRPRKKRVRGFGGAIFFSNEETAPLFSSPQVCAEELVRFHVVRRITCHFNCQKLFFSVFPVICADN